MLQRAASVAIAMIIALSLLSLHDKVFAAGRVFDMWVPTHINNQPQFYQFFTVLKEAGKDDIVNIYLQGLGGNVQTGLNLINFTKKSKATINTIVYGNVYSMHAILAISLPNLQILDKEALFLFHVPARTNKQLSGNYMGTDYCDMAHILPTIDRGTTKKENCYKIIKAEDKYFSNYNKKVLSKALSVEELKKYYEGHDVIVPAKVIERRLKR